MATGSGSAATGGEVTASDCQLGAAAAVTESASGSILEVPVSDPTTAALVAAGRSGSGVRLVPHDWFCSQAPGAR